MKLISWNIDSLNAALTAESPRAMLSRAVIDTLVAEDADIIAIQETKLSDKGPTKKHLEILESYFPDYKNTWRSSVEPARKGYAGTLFLYKNHLTPVISFPEIGAPSTMDAEGRIITLEFDHFYVTQVYTPNAGDGLKRLADRQIWDTCYADYLSQLDNQKPVLATGDYNVAHKEIDLANPASNRQSPGFTDEERQGFTNLLAKGFTDTFRFLHGDIPSAYTWWAQRSRTSKINNTGWRIDYWLVSNRIADKVTKSAMIDSGARQDHTPIVMEITI
ncbi:exodeoxyribonuclease III [Streptococcus ruminantium]|uniref:Exodeoxyribonuclease III n=1 Tax=Streptococcus ruminantium TaxID=1917441 RepID=A0ABU1B446_9STRE|nr:exodeoxyribonuclease III [Streptococcus ruminantium]MDQ8758916.1 exodeoxyribonuclease III [Streptococcus ruminantium]MDQ8764142.1 exodeoxyribonuclease III [Streptococcus ruminantium]MDQ8768745.1 exodeoxyribonuclease III [Streptococcus ruminantium]MDQ8774215.1 exodeoxyribonuclease III [Streptococcus ruminantium]MDQ8794066.1 exodeoxyribonuclease III [Streptococcus ruminantium]